MLEIEGLDAFYGDATALHEVSIRVAAGEIVAVVGPNGAGKSTLVNVIAGIHRERRGRISMNGRDLASLAGHRYCDMGIAVVPEGRRLFPQMSVRDNLELGAYRRAARGVRAKRWTWVHELFPWLAGRHDQLAGSLSGGEQQMVAIGRALMADPRLLLLDEPSLGLAPVIVDEVFEVITVIHRSGVGVLLVEQSVERALALSDRAYLLMEGRVVMDGAADTLSANDEVRRTVLGM
jgi:branched-chain amino acid transport system ATP-binding protein